MIFAIVPVKRFENSKSRLASLFSIQQRKTLSELMLDNTLGTLAASKCFAEVLVVTSDSRAKEIAEKRGAKTLFQERDAGVNSAVTVADAYSAKAGAQATVVVPEDLPLMSADDVAGVCALAKNNPCIAVCPSTRLDGTNILLRRPPTAIATHYDNNSYENHLQAAKQVGITAQVVHLKNLMFDLDTPDDVKELTGMSDTEIAAKSTALFIRSALSRASR